MSYKKADTAANSASASRLGALYNKREMFFRNDAPAAPAASPSVAPPAASQAAAAAAGGGATPAVAKEALTASHSNGRGNKENLPDPSVGVGRSGSTVGAGAGGGGAAGGSKMTSHQPPSSLPTPSALSSKSSSASTPAPSASSAPSSSSATVQSHRAAAPTVSSAAAAAAAAAARPAVAGAAPGAVRAAASAMANAGSQRQRQLDGYVGFANLPNQVYRRAVKRGFHFTLMVVGEAGLGKSTLVNSLFMSELYSSDYPGPSERVKKTVQVEKTVVQLKENGVNLTLTVVDTPGFGDAVDNSNCWQPVIDFIEQQYATYLNAESLLHRSQSVQDTRVHCCLYFIAPSGHTLKPLDVEFMRRLHDKVNIVPVIAKADTMTPEEVAHFKRQVMNEINQHKIKIYEFPDCDDDEENRSQRQLRDRVPFAVVGANTIVEVDGKKVRGRRYPWGTVQVDNMEHSDFIPLRKMLICTHMTDLCAVTSNVHYENYRCRSLAALSGDGKTNKILNKNPLTQMEEERQEQELRLEKFKSEMQLVFDQKVKEKKGMLEQSEANFRDKKREMDEWLKREWNELETRRYDLLRKRKAFQQEHGISWEEMRRKDKEHGDHKKKRKGIF